MSLRNLDSNLNILPGNFPPSSNNPSFFHTTMLRRQISSPSLKIAVSTIKSTGSAPNSPGLTRGLVTFNLHHQGSALASPQPSPRFLDFYPALPHSPTIAKSRLECHPQSNFSSSAVSADPTPPDPPRAAKVWPLIDHYEFSN